MVGKVTICNVILGTIHYVDIDRSMNVDMDTDIDANICICVDIQQ